MNHDDTKSTKNFFDRMDRIYRMCINLMNKGSCTFRHSSDVREFELQRRLSKITSNWK